MIIKQYKNIYIVYYIMESNEPQNKYIDVVDISGSVVSVLDNEINYDIYNEFEIVKYTINHTTDMCGNLFYSIDKIPCMTDNYVAECYDIHYINSKTNIKVNIGTETEYKIFNKNKGASELFGMDLAGNVIFWFDCFLNDTELTQNLKQIKNESMRTGLIDAINIKI